MLLVMTTPAVDTFLIFLSLTESSLNSPTSSKAEHFHLIGQFMIRTEREKELKHFVFMERKLHSAGKDVDDSPHESNSKQPCYSAIISYHILSI